MLKGRQIADPVERVGLRLQLRERRGEARDIVLLYGDESEALAHPYLARAWARSGADRPGRSRYWGRSIIGRAGSSLSRGHPNPYVVLVVGASGLASAIYIIAALISPLSGVFVLSPAPLTRCRRPSRPRRRREEPSVAGPRRR
jgi:hypothetical protein